MSLTIKIPTKKNNSNNSVPDPSNARRKSTRRRVTTDSEEDDYEPSPTHSESKHRRKQAPRVKGEREDDSSLRDSARVRDRSQPGGSKRPRDDPLSVDEPEGQLDATVSPDVDSSANATATAALGVVKEESTSVSLPPFKKKRLPPIKKNKPNAVPSTNLTPNHPATGKPGQEAKAGPSLVQEESVDTLSVLKRPKRINNQQEVNLNDKSVYESLFKHSGGSIPRAGLNLKEKEERRRELDGMREEDRRRRAADAEHVFDLRAQHNKITSFVERLQARRSGALWPNILAVAFRQERERDDHRREQERARQGEVTGKRKESGEVPEER
ncbi:hypothetical protein EDB86DRAFT_3071729 [Lactarius hatsudake]|nr:hypothetical protein EDB86DRAFT_3071729 [Lactarius hatsudake]